MVDHLAVNFHSVYEIADRHTVAELQLQQKAKDRTHEYDTGE